MSMYGVSILILFRCVLTSVRPNFSSDEVTYLQKAMDWGIVRDSTKYDPHSANRSLVSVFRFRNTLTEILKLFAR